MKKNRIEKVPGSGVNIGEKQSQAESVEKLEEVHMEQTENRGREEHCGKFAVFAEAVYEQFAEDVLFQHRGEDHHHQNGVQRIAHDIVHQGIFCGAAGE